MLFSNAAVLLLGALQPALGTPTLLRRAGDETKNEILSQYQTPTATVIIFRAPTPGCGNTRAWVGVWPTDACNPYWADFKAWQYVEPIEGYDYHRVTFNNAELGIGEYKAAFVCEDGRRQPWLVSKTFKVDGENPTNKQKGERCNKIDECGDGLYCKDQCGNAVEDHQAPQKKILCLIAGEPTCEPVE
ncbi:hypothetical protein ARSEF1564_008454 [Beauveria bassiana]